MEDYIKLSDLMCDSSTDVVLEYIRSKNISAETFADLEGWMIVQYCSSPVGMAIKYGHLLVMNELINMGFDPHVSCIVEQVTSYPLYLACEYNRLDIILSLHHDHGIDIDFVDDFGVTALVETVSNRSENKLDVVKTLVEAGASVNCSSNNEGTPLFAAISRGNIDVCRYLISKGADVSAWNKEPIDGTYLMTALVFGRAIDIVRLLVDSGDDVNAANDYNQSALMYATDRYAEIDVIRLLLDCGADVNALDEMNKSPLCYALTGDCFYPSDDNMMEERVKVLIKYGAKVNLMDNDHQSPLLYALRSRANSEVIKLLMEAGADVNVLDRNQVSPLMYAVKEGGNIDVIKVLIKYGANVNALDTYTESALCYAMTYSNRDEQEDVGADINALGMESCSEHTINIVDHLITSGADVNALNINNVSPLMRALKYISDVKPIVNVARLLLDSGAKVNVVDKDRKSPLHYAVEYSGRDHVRTNIIQVLVDSGADVNIQDENGDSPLMYALKYKASVELILLLLKCGVDVCARNKGNISPLSFVFKEFDDFKHMEKDDGEVINLVEMFEECAGDVKGHLVTLPDTRRIHDAFDAIRTLCTKGADIEARDGAGNTVLHQVMTKIVPCSCAKCFNFVHFLIVELNVSLWTLNNANQTSFHCALKKTEFRQEEVGKILTLCVQAGYTPNSEEMAVVQQIEEELSMDIKGSDVTSLLDICCFSVRRALGRRLPTAVNSLPIPEKLKQYVKLTHVETTVETKNNTVEYQRYFLECDDDDYDDDDDDDEYDDDDDDGGGGDDDNDSDYYYENHYDDQYYFLF